jgi:hypothetical protein
MTRGMSYLTLLVDLPPRWRPRRRGTFKREQQVHVAKLLAKDVPYQEFMRRHRRAEGAETAHAPSKGIRVWLSRVVRARAFPGPSAPPRCAADPWLHDYTKLRLPAAGVMAFGSSDRARRRAGQVGCLLWGAPVLWILDRAGQDVRCSSSERPSRTDSTAPGPSFILARSARRRSSVASTLLGSTEEFLGGIGSRSSTSSRWRAPSSFDGLLISGLGRTVSALRGPVYPRSTVSREARCPGPRSRTCSAPTGGSRRMPSTRGLAGLYSVL